MRRFTIPLSFLFAASLFCAATALLADPPLPDTVSKVCRPTESAIFFGSRYHVRCNTPLLVGRYYDQQIPYFSIPDSNADQVAQAMAVVHEAMSSGKSIRLWIRTSPLQNPPGCQSGDCRSFFGVTLLD